MFASFRPMSTNEEEDYHDYNYEPSMSSVWSSCDPDHDNKGRRLLGNYSDHHHHHHHPGNCCSYGDSYYDYHHTNETHPSAYDNNNNHHHHHHHHNDRTSVHNQPFPPQQQPALSQQPAQQYSQHYSKPPQPQSSHDPEEEYCGVYMALSTIPGAGLGLFAGHWDFEPGQRVIPGDVVVPIYDYAHHTTSYYLPQSSFQPPPVSFYWEDYYWSSTFFDHVAEEATTVQPMHFGLGAAPNCHFALNNLQHNHHDAMQLDSTTTTGQPAHPGAGASTPFFNVQGVAKKAIAAGQELFLSYGEHYFQDRPYLQVPLTHHYQQGNQLLKKFVRLRNAIRRTLLLANHKNTTVTTTTNTTTAAEEHAYNESISMSSSLSLSSSSSSSSGMMMMMMMSDLYHLLRHDLFQIWATTNDDQDNNNDDDDDDQTPFLTLRTLPDDYAQVDPPAAARPIKNNKKKDNNDGLYHYHRQTSRRDLDWLAQHGHCADQLELGTSTIPYAGRGAFARRPIRQGHVIAPVPLIHVPHRSVLNMYQPRYGGDDAYFQTKPRQQPAKNQDPQELPPEPHHFQLMLNYCFGHADTTLLLCPYGLSTALVNHARAAAAPGAGAPPGPPFANAKLVWSHRLMRHPEWLNLTLSEWVTQQSAGLVWELVATRDLAPGEEVLLDYGEAWDQAWTQHVSQWPSSTAASSSLSSSSCTPISALALNQDDDLLLPPAGGTLSAHFSLLNPRYCDSTGIPSRRFPELQCHKLLFGGILWGVPVGGGGTSEDEDDDSLYLPCRIVIRSPSSKSHRPEESWFIKNETPTMNTTTTTRTTRKSQYVYTVELLKRTTSLAAAAKPLLRSCTETVVGVALGVSGDIFHFVDRPYTRDTLQPWSFRHEMQIPDELLPDAWRNNKKNDQKLHKNHHQDDSGDDNNDNEENHSCGVYLAPSTISGAGMGLFAGRGFDRGNMVTPGDVFVPIYDYKFHNSYDGADKTFYWKNYVWTPEEFDGAAEEARKTSLMSFGIGAAPNCHFALNNLEHAPYKHLAVGTTAASLSAPMGRDPGAGASTIFYNVQGVATKRIRQGQELFVYYGHGYFEGRPYLEVPLTGHFEVGNKLIKKFAQLTDEIAEATIKKSANNNVHPWIRDLYYLIRDDLLDIWKVSGDKDEDKAKGKENSYLALKTLPSNFDDVAEAAAKGIWKYHRKHHMRSIDWLEQHGTCADNLDVGTSTIPHAGRGAFTRRPIPNGQTIAPVPLIHVEHRSVLNMYEQTYGTSYTHPFHNARKYNVAEEPLHQQLMLNYCFGHAETDLLLCPYGVGTALVNHAKEGQGANAKLVWSDKLSRNLEWLNMTPSEWASQITAGLVWELVATRDLAEGEEVLLDYGDEWDKAWKQHVANWSPPVSNCTPISAYELNQENGNLVVPSSMDGNISSQFSSLNPRYCESTEIPTELFPEFFCRQMYLDMWGLSEDIFITEDEESDEEEEATYLPCRILSRSRTAISNSRRSDQDSTSQLVYTVEILKRKSLEKPHDVCTEVPIGVLFGVASDIFYFVDRPYTRDSLQPWSFRHEIQIPEELLPAAWRTKFPSDDQANKNKCGIYFAPSTIPGAGMGLFAGRSFDRGNMVTPGDVLVPIYDYKFHNSYEGADKTFYWEDYVWNANAFEGVEMSDATALSSMSFGIGAALNCHFALNNIRHDHSTINIVAGTTANSQLTPMGTDPGAGASTIFYNVQGVAIKGIKQGQELFLSYGTDYFETRPYLQVPTRKDFKNGKVLLYALVELRDRIIQTAGSPVTMANNDNRQAPLWMNDLYSLIRNDFYDIWKVDENDTDDNDLQEEKERSPLALRTLPVDYTEVDDAVGMGFWKYHRKHHIRSVDWLEQHGACADNLDVGTSTIPHAGRGAFTKRPISKGETIAPVPLLHVEHRSVLNMYEQTYGTSYTHPFHNARKYNVAEEPRHQQLMLNYCFGHAETDLLLCPYGVGTALVNHAKEGQGANAKLVWSDKLSRNLEWLNRTPSEWASQTTAGLVWELVATRDLAEGEEVLLDYGDEWDTAWKQHVANWSPPVSNCTPISAYELNQENGNLVVPTSMDGNISSQFSSLNPRYCESTEIPTELFPELHCRQMYLEMWGLSEDVVTANDGESLSPYLPCRVVTRLESTTKGDGKNEIKPNERSPDMGHLRYTVELLNRETIGKGLRTCTETITGVLFGVPVEVFYFVDRPYSSDTLQPWSFRHEMQIPDSLLPSAWRAQRAAASDRHDRISRTA
ncbi:hypothetical protein ACA910_022627 [Epithemia clementina (nom. ined.)]